MKAIVFSLLFIFIQGCTAQALESRNGSTSVAGRQPLLVELFTSEGCSSCPPAEKLLASYQRDQPFEGAELVTLAFHVDYWDDLGWKDKYASPLFTQRQRVYDRKFRTGQIYTPQMVVDGDIEFVGSREKDAKRAFKKAAKIVKAQMELGVEANKVQVTLAGMKLEESATLYFAIAEDNISTDVNRGENAGKNLNHLSVVRSLTGVTRIGMADASHSGTYDVQIQEGWNRDNLKLVVFVQENRSRNIVAVGQIKLDEEEVNHQRGS